MYMKLYMNRCGNFFLNLKEKEKLNKKWFKMSLKDFA